MTRAENTPLFDLRFKKNSIAKMEKQLKDRALLCLYEARENLEELSMMNSEEHCSLNALIMRVAETSQIDVIDRMVKELRQKNK